jgi:hypothetical protein
MTEGQPKRLLDQLRDLCCAGGVMRSRWLRVESQAEVRTRFTLSTLNCPLAGFEPNSLLFRI